MGVSDNANQLVCVTRMEFTSEKFEASDRRPSVYDTFDLVEGLERAGGRRNRRPSFVSPRFASCSSTPSVAVRIKRKNSGENSSASCRGEIGSCWIFFFFFRNLEPLIRCVAIFHFSKICRQVFFCFGTKMTRRLPFLLFENLTRGLCVWSCLITRLSLCNSQPFWWFQENREVAASIFTGGHRWLHQMSSRLLWIDSKLNLGVVRPNVNELDKNHRNVNKIPEVAWWNSAGKSHRGDLAISESDVHTNVKKFTTI